jgi:hypothetical protein
MRLNKKPPCEDTKSYEHDSRFISKKEREEIREKELIKKKKGSVERNYNDEPDMGGSYSGTDEFGNM